MKKNIKIVIASLIFATTCFGQTVTTQNQILLRTQTDSLNYTLGVANGDGIKNYYLKDKPLEEFIGVFMKYLDAGFATNNQFVKPDSTNKYADIIELGNKVGNALKTQVSTGLMGNPGLNVDLQIIRKGLEDGLRSNFSILSAEGAQKYLQETMIKISQQSISPEDKLNKTACEEFLAKNKLRKEVITTKSGLQYEILKKGKGSLPTETSNVKVTYIGTKIDGTVIDDRSKPKQALVFKLSETIKGWMEAIQLMPVGSKFKIYIPQELAYGIVKKDEIKPYSALIFEIELLSFEK
ncbi:MAG: FKBP-type peptidyl-prolyl cis-trans isomerase [Paludibacter sp.]|nr:FKBP-type peptidyl-prolyl cis-trans isomerase [Paludibacter sp.]